MHKWVADVSIRAGCLYFGLSLYLLSYSVKMQACAGLSALILLTNAINTKILGAGSFILRIFMSIFI